MGEFTYNKDSFLLNGKPYTIISGAIHYFRVHPDYWFDRLAKLKACGFNTVETYVCWNLHERREGEFNFSGNLDIVKFIELAKEIGLNVIVRPGPYICAEWDFGGLPSWLLSYDNITLRCNDPLYLQKVAPYYKELFSRLRPHLITNGGNIIMVQLENEYGSYGDDKEYLKKVHEMYIENGIDCTIFTCDGTLDWMLSGGTLEGVLSVANFGSAPKMRKDIMKAFRPNQPFMCGEFWCGWFDHWYKEHTNGKPEETAQMVQEFFDVGGSFNFYMFHGGTNFGFNNGANYDVQKGEYQPTVTSYDYGAPLSEAGDLTETYFAIKEIIEKYTGVKNNIEVKNTPKAAYGTLELTETAPLFENLSKISEMQFSANLKTMEQLGQDFGYILYSTEVKGAISDLPLIFTKLHDRAHIFINGEFKGIYERTKENPEIVINLSDNETATLQILVENMGRVNYGPKLLDKKGIVGGVRFEQRFHFGWEHYPLTMENLENLNFTEGNTSTLPAFFKGTLNIDGTPKDTFIKPSGFTKGFITVNGFNIGRYFNPAGPQKTLYIPAPLLKTGDNEIIVFETDMVITPTVEFVDKPELE